MDELKTILEGMKNVETHGDSTLIMAQCMVLLTKYINDNDNITKNVSSKKEAKC